MTAVEDRDDAIHRAAAAHLAEAGFDVSHVGATRQQPTAEEIASTERWLLARDVTRETRRLVAAGRSGRVDIQAEYAAAAARSKTASQARRDRVLRWPDLAKQLCEPPLNYRRPQDWNGWVPPRTVAYVDHNYAPANDSPWRAALVTICAEALRRDETEQLKQSDQRTAI